MFDSLTYEVATLSWFGTDPSKSCVCGRWIQYRVCVWAWSQV